MQDRSQIIVERQAPIIIIFTWLNAGTVYQMQYSVRWSL